MATKAIILTPCDDVSLNTALQNTEQEYNAIQVSADGYPSYVLREMKEFLKNYDVQVLMAGGNVRTIERNYEPNPLGYHSTEYPQSSVCIVYSRDIEDENIDKSKFKMKQIKMRERKENFPYSDYIYAVYKDEILYSSNIGELEFKKAEDYTGEE